MVWAGLMWSSSERDTEALGRDLKQGQLRRGRKRIRQGVTPTGAVLAALLVHPAVVGRAVSVAGQGDGGPRDADAGLPVLVVPDPAARQVGGPARLRQLAHRAGRQRRVALRDHIGGVSGRGLMC